MMAAGKMRTGTGLQGGSRTQRINGWKQTAVGADSRRFGLSILNKYGYSAFCQGGGKAEGTYEEVSLVFREEPKFNPETLLMLLELFLRQGKRNGREAAAKTILNQTILYQIRNQVQFLLTASEYGGAVREACRALRDLSIYTDRGQVERAFEVLRSEVKKNGLRG